MSSHFYFSKSKHSKHLDVKILKSSLKLKSLGNPATLAIKKQVIVLFQPWNDVSESARHFIKSLICLDPRGRLTAEEALLHPWIQVSHHGYHGYYGYHGYHGYNSNNSTW